jgi:hypothetical protein
MRKNHSQSQQLGKSQFSHSAATSKSNPVFEIKYYFGHLTLSISHFPAGFFTLCNTGNV